MSDPSTDTNTKSGAPQDLQEVRLPNENMARTLPRVVHPKGVVLRVANSEDDLAVACFYHDMWADFGIDNILADDWQVQTLEFIAHARAQLDYTAFIAETLDSSVVSVTPSLEEIQQPNNENETVTASASPQILGVAACQRFAGPYPFAFVPDKRLYGYIWGVRVVPAARRQGLATLLTKACCDYLGQLGCNRVLLHASPQGRKVYEQLGFETSNEMRLELSQPTDN
jgi:ribosomal protein S18 acetylase RimI-like enzyme